jgi:hypothetical protein
MQQITEGTKVHGLEGQMPATKTYTVTSAAGQVLAKGLDKKAAAAMVRKMGGPAAATFKEEESPVSFAPAEQFTVGEWAETLRGAGYMKRGWGVSK